MAVSRFELILDERSKGKRYSSGAENRG